MKVMASVLGLAFALCCSPLQAEERQPTKQQLRMKACNQQAREQSLKGDERKTFMKGCLSGKTEITDPPAAGPQPAAPSCKQQADEQQLTGSERKKFMADCKK